MNTTKPSLLIVDDSIASAESMKMLFYAADFPAVTAYSANEARRMLNRFSFDVMLLDYLMDPQINGLDFLRGCRKDGIKIPVVICSGIESYSLDRVSETISFEGLGPCKVMAKPAEPSVLISEVERLGNINRQGVKV